VREAHGRAEMMEFNYLLSTGNQRDASGRYAVDFSKMPAAVATLAKELLEIERHRRPDRAEKWFAKYGAMPADLQTASSQLRMCQSTSTLCRRSLSQ